MRREQRPSERPAARPPQRVLGGVIKSSPKLTPFRCCSAEANAVPATPDAPRRDRPGSTSTPSEARPPREPPPRMARRSSASPTKGVEVDDQGGHGIQRETSAVADADGPFTHPGVPVLAEREVIHKAGMGEALSAPPIPVHSPGAPRKPRFYPTFGSAFRASTRTVAASRSLHRQITRPSIGLREGKIYRLGCASGPLGEVKGRRAEPVRSGLSSRRPGATAVPGNGQLLRLRLLLAL